MEEGGEEDGLDVEDSIGHEREEREVDTMLGGLKKDGYFGHGGLPHLREYVQE